MTTLNFTGAPKKPTTKWQAILAEFAADDLQPSRRISYAAVSLKIGNARPAAAARRTESRGIWRNCFSNSR